MKNLATAVVVAVIAVILSTNSANAGFIVDFALAKDAGMISNSSDSDEIIFCCLVTHKGSIISLDGSQDEILSNISSMLEKEKKFELIVYHHDVTIFKEFLNNIPNIVWDVKKLVLSNENKPSEYMIIKIKKIKQQ